MSGRGLGGFVAVAVMIAGGVAVLGDPRDQAGAGSPGSSRECPAQVDDWDREQTRHAKVIVRVGRDMDMGRRGVVVALATAMQESALRNPDHGPPGEDSMGLFQQRPSMGWGTPAEVMTPRYAARAFYRALRRVPGWRQMPLTDAAQSVQRSAHRDAYAKHEDAAKSLARALAGCR